jgi:hypothetical protein
MAVVIGGAIPAGAAIILEGAEVAAITAAGRAVVIAAGIEIHKREAASWRPLSFPRGTVFD